MIQLVPADWQAYRAIRLAMLLDSPAAFGGTFEEAVRHEEQHWRKRLRDNVVLLATVDGSPAGSVMFTWRTGSTFIETRPGDCALYGMWVDPRFRAAGVGRALVDAVVDAARGAGRRRVVLHVVAGNTPAADLYERTGFARTGRTFPNLQDDHVVEVEMEHVLSDGLGPPSAGEVS